MRLISLACLLTLLVSLLMAGEPVSETLPSAPLNVADNAGWLRFIKARDKTLTRVTDKPQSMDLHVARRCDLPRPQDLPETNPHRGHYVHVYVTPNQEKTIRTGEGKYPVGTLIVKEKFPGPFAEANLASAAPKAGAKAPDQPELFTVMLKREVGYHPDCGDWEFMVVSGDARQILARGKLDSCVACHKDHKETDFVTQLYPQAKR